MFIKMISLKMCVLQCDTCQKIFERRYHKNICDDNRKHYCCSRCVQLNRKHSVEHNQKISQSLMGDKNPFWNKQHDEKTLLIMQQKQQAYESSLTDAQRKLRSDKISDRVSGDKNPFWRKKHSDESRTKMSNTRSQLIAEGKISCGPRGRHGVYVSTKTNIEEKYDSFFELLRMKILDNDSNVKFWTKQHNIKISYFWQSKNTFYIPDFYIEYFDKIVIEEVKGYEDETKLNAKINALNNFCQQNSFEVSYINFDILQKMSIDLYGESIASLRRKLLT